MSEHSNTGFEHDQRVPIEEPVDHFTRLASLNEHQHRAIFLQAIGRVMAFCTDGTGGDLEAIGRNLTVLEWLLRPTTLDGLGKALGMSRQAATTRAKQMQKRVDGVIREARKESQEFQSLTTNH